MRYFVGRLSRPFFLHRATSVATIDRFISLMFEKQGTSLVVESDKPIMLALQGVPRPATKDPLPAPKVLAVIKEIMPQGMHAQLDAGDGRLVFGHEVNGHRVDVETLRSGPAVSMTLSPAKPRRSTAAMSMPAEALLMNAPPAAPAPAAAAPRASQPAVDVAGRAEERLQELLRYLVDSKSSDLHMRVGLPPTYRTHGELEPHGDKPLTKDDIESMILSIMPDRNKAEYAESNDTDYAYEILDLARFRVNALRDRMGPAAVFRVIPTKIVTVEELGISAEVQKLCYLTKGLVVVTGPTGSGKSTTLAAMVDLINRTRTDHIITIEDPIEFVHPNKKCVVTQRQVGSHTQSFKRALRAALREDPDIVLIGEMRDLETVAIAIETAETGHLVFGTLHTTTAVSTVDRIIDQFPADRQAQIRIMLSESLKGVIAQVLCKKIGGGRVAPREILLAAASVSNLIREGKTYQLPSIIQTSKKLGMITLNDSLIEFVDKKLVTPEEAYMKAVDKAGLEMLLKARNIKVELKE
jgi:twitching motility protein PilT